jgi:nitrate reductase NapD
MTERTLKRIVNIAPVAEGHIAGIVVHAGHDHIPAVLAAISALPGATVHAVSPAGKVVVTLEAGRAAEIIAQLDSIHALPGVYSAALIYQHHEDVESLNEEIDDETDASGVH